MENVDIKFPKKNKIKDIQEIDEECFGERSGVIQVKKLKKRIDKREIVTAEIGDEIVGYLVFNQGEKSLQANRLGVSSSHRRKGVGKKLINYLEEVAKTRGGEKIVLCHVRQSNKAALKFYKKHGYNMVKREEGFYSDGENAYRLMKNIS